MDRADLIHQNFLRRVKEDDLPIAAPSISLEESGLDGAQLITIFEAQVLSRQLDRVSRKLQARGEGFYTIGSSGHEGNAAIAAAFKPTDMAFLHYRGAAFQIMRSNQLPTKEQPDPLWDMLLSFTTSSEDPISGGRHKVLGSKALNIPPQTSTIASHLPKAVGAAYSIGLGKHITPEHQALDDESVVLCSFGDASLNHSTAQGALNTASWLSYQQAPLPLVFVCEDNGIGISVETPENWVQVSVTQRPALHYINCNGLDVVATYRAACEAEQHALSQQQPVFLHMQCVRLMGHAGPDTERAYLSKQQIEQNEAHDPLLYTARRLINEQILSNDEVIALYNGIEERTFSTAEKAIKRPRLQEAKQVMASIVPPKRTCKKPPAISKAQREAAFGQADMLAINKPQHMAKLINFTLTELMLKHPELILMGEDVGPKGGVYGVTQRLHKRFGARRVVDTLLDEQSILGLAIGLAHNGFIPLPEIQFLAYLHNAEDQLRGEAATLPFFSNGQYSNPMVVRIAGLGYQKGFGGHFHNDNSLAVLRDIPGLIVACPSNGHDAALMLQECVRLAREEQRIVAFVEPIALYMTKDLHEQGDNSWTQVYADLKSTQRIGLHEVGQSGNGTDLAIVSYANGYYLSRQAQADLAAQNINARVIDLRWIAPLAEEAILAATADCDKVLIVDECRRSGSPSEALMTLFSERSEQTVRRYTAEDSFIATGPAYAATLPSREGIVAAAQALLVS